MTEDYANFLKSKRSKTPNYGVEIDPQRLNPQLFPWQRDLVRWSCRKGRSALFADCGLGKTPMQLEWAQLLGQKTLILAPLAVAQQTVREGEKFGVEVHYCRRQEDATGQITITNYQMLDKFDPAAFNAVVLDESGILKNFEGKTRTRLIEAFKDCFYRLCCTATPAPNDIAEIANHAEFLGVMPRTEMLATFFIHDDNGWRLKGHARQDFYRWLASWAMWLRKPSDLGYPDDAFILPELTITPEFVRSDYVPEGQLFFTGLKGIGNRTQVRKATKLDRVERVAQMVNRDRDSQWIIWCGLNDESKSLYRLIEGSVDIEGSDPIEKKEQDVQAFLEGEARILITKSGICGHGLNLQNCHKMAFVGLSDSYEQYYQAIRRCWRFGQNEPVEVFIILSELEDAIYQNVLAKEREAELMAGELIANIEQFEKAEIGKGQAGTFEYREEDATGEGWELKLGDSVVRLREIEADSVGLSVYSPPFLSLYTYSATECDLGNSRTPEEFWRHFEFIIRELLRVTMPGRNSCCHVSQVPAMLARDGYIGMKDFRGQTINAFESAGWIYHGEVCIDKDPQAQAIRTHSKGLLFNQLRKDASWLRPGLADFILVFRKPGDNPEPILPDLSNNEWIEWARPIWYGIRESDTLRAAGGTVPEDERHICPLQLGTIERCVRLWSNKGDLVLDPFSGIGSTGVKAITNERRFIGCELKPSYWKVAVENLREAERDAGSSNLFSFAGVSV